MPPPVALAMTLLFVAFALRTAFKLQKTVSNAVWIPISWMVICASRSLTQWLNISPAEADYDTAALEGSLVDELFLASLILLGLIVLLKRKERFVSILVGNKAILLFFFFLGLSALWSDIPLVSARRWVRLFGGLLMACVVLTERNPPEAVKAAIRVCAYVLIPLSLLYAKYFPELGVLYSYRGEKILAGVALEKNDLGHLCIVSAFFLIYGMIFDRGVRHSDGRSTRWIVEMIVLAMATWLLIESRSSTSVAALILGVGICLLFRFRVIRTHVKATGTIAVLIIVILVALQRAFNLVGVVVEILGRDMTFTGRVPMWEVLIDLGMQKPLLGYGYGAFWIGERLHFIWDQTGLFFRIGHNGYLETFVEGGFIGLIVLALAIRSAFNSIEKTLMRDFDYGVLCMALLVMILLCNVTESSFARPQDYLWFLFLLIGIRARAKRPATVSIRGGGASPYAGGPPKPFSVGALNKPRIF